MEGDNTFVFIYTAKAAVPYTVKYLKIDQDGNVIGNAFPPKVVSDNKKAIVTEQFKPLSGWMPDKYQKELVVVEGGTNEIIFYYTEDDKHALVLKTHYLEPIVSSEDLTTWIVYPNAGGQITGEVGQTYSETPVTIPGFAFYADESKTSGKLTTDGLHLQLYYKRLSYPYKVQYLEENTNKKLADETLTDANGKQLTGKYEQVVSANAIDIENYELVSAATLTTTIKIEDPAGDAAKNVITFYYKEKEVAINYVPVFDRDNDGDYDVMSESERQTIGDVDRDSESLPIITGGALGSTAILADPSSSTYKFEGWYSDPECKNLVSSDPRYVPEQPGRTIDAEGNTVYGLWPEETTFYAKFDWNVADLTITKTGMQAGETAIFTVTATHETLGVQTYTITVVNGDSVTIPNLIIGSSYTVEEMGDWTWRYKSTSYEADDEAGNSGTIQTAGSKVVCTNSDRNDQWLDAEYGVHNDFASSGDGTKIQ